MPKFKSPNETVLVFLNTVSAIYQKYYRFQELNICTLKLNQNGINYYCSSCNLNVDYLAEYWPQYNWDAPNWIRWRFRFRVNTANLRIERIRRRSLHGVWKLQKKSHSTLRAKRARLHFEWTKLHYKCHKRSILASFWKLEAFGQTVLPDRSVF